MRKHLFSCLTDHMFFVYILQSQKNARFYIGYSEDPDRRLLEHNSGKVTSTKPHRPWIKIYVEQFKTEQAAIVREREMKAKKSRKYLEWLVSRAQTCPDENWDD